MTGGWLGWLGNILPILLLMPLVWLVASFLLESLRSDQPSEPDTPKTRKSILTGAAWDVFLVGLWTYVLVNEVRDADGSRVFIGVLMIGICLVTFQIIRSLLEAYRLNSAETAPPRA
jgi:hypothetical protein